MDVENLSNEVGTVKGAEVIFCPSCGENKTQKIKDTDDEGNAYTWERGPVGYADFEWAQNNWHEVDGALYCSAYCSAIGSGASEEEAQEARAKHTEKAAEGLRRQRVDEARAILEAEGEL